MQSIGLIAGNGSFPALFITEAHKRAVKVFTVALSGEAGQDEVSASDTVTWVNIGKVGKIISAFKKNGISEAVLAGQVKHTKLFTEVSLDFKALALLKRIKDKRAVSILSAFCDELESEGIKVLSSLTFLDGHLVRPGRMCGKNLSKAELGDLEFGSKIASALAGLDIGQSVVVKNRAVIAVEGFEGTDECILRAAKYAGPGTVLVKVARPSQDLRYDVPVFGLRTVETMSKAGTRVAAFTTGKTLILDIDSALQLAGEKGITIWGI